MKLHQILNITLVTLIALGLAACGDSKPGDDGHDHDHDGEHKHEKGDGDHHDDDHKHGDADDHDGSKHVKDPGPNGGRVIHTVEPHLEFLVTENRHVKITALDDDLQPTAIGAQEVGITAGDRSNPISMELVKEGDALLSKTAFPAGDDFPVVLQIKNGDTKAVFEKFTLDLSQCPTCDYLEYACICEHGDGDHDHDHKHK